MTTQQTPAFDIQDGPLADAFQDCLRTYAPLAPRDGTAGGDAAQEAAHQAASEAFEAALNEALNARVRELIAG